MAEFVTGVLRDLLLIGVFVYMNGVWAGAIVLRVHLRNSDPEPSAEFWRRAFRYTLGWPVQLYRYLWG